MNSDGTAAAVFVATLEWCRYQVPSSASLARFGNRLGSIESSERRGSIGSGSSSSTRTTTDGRSAGRLGRGLRSGGQQVGGGGCHQEHDGGEHRETTDPGTPEGDRLPSLLRDGDGDPERDRDRQEPAVGDSMPADRATWMAAKAGQPRHDHEVERPAGGRPPPRGPRRRAPPAPAPDRGRPPPPPAASPPRGTSWKARVVGASPRTDSRGWLMAKPVSPEHQDEGAGGCPADGQVGRDGGGQLSHRASARRRGAKPCAEPRGPRGRPGGSKVGVEAPVAR